MGYIIIAGDVFEALVRCAQIWYCAWLQDKKLLVGLDGVGASIPACWDIGIISWLASGEGITGGVPKA